MSFQALWKFNPSGCWSIILRNPSPSRCLAPTNGPTSMARRPPSRTSCATVSFAPLFVASYGHVERLARHLEGRAEGEDGPRGGLRLAGGARGGVLPAGASAGSDPLYRRGQSPELFPDKNTFVVAYCSSFT